MDGFALIVAIVMLGLIWIGENSKAGLYLAASWLLAGLLALRMGDPLFYLSMGILILALAARMFFTSDESPGSDSEDEDEL